MEDVKEKFVIDPLPYAYDSLEPLISEQIMTLHHDKHYQIYTDKLNDALAGNPELMEKSIEEILGNLEAIPEKIRTAVKNHGGGYFNHGFFWPLLKKNTVVMPETLKVMDKDFGGMDNFKKDFSKAAMSVFGSGWAWLVYAGGKFEIMTTANQETPISQGKEVMMVIDVWEHAYYPQYMNRRADYVEAFWNVINWEKVEENIKKVLISKNTDE